VCSMTLMSYDIYVSKPLLNYDKNVIPEIH
jgi:hypothetical protein